MKVRIGQTFKTTDPSDAAKQFQKTVLKAVKKQVIYTSKPFMEKLGQEIQEIAINEAHQMFEVLADKIDQQSTGDLGLTASDLAVGMTSPISAGGSVAWAPLSYHYLLQKMRRFSGASKTFIANDQRMFRFGGYLSGYFRRESASIVDTRFGGVDLKVNTEGLDENPRFDGDVDQLSFGDDLKEFLIGRLSLTIFPNISPSLLPGLASSRWTATLQRPDFEDSMFSDLRTAQKLSQHHGDNYYYRPLVLPAVQFWVMVRIPAAIQAALSQRLNRSRIKKVSRGAL